MQRKGTALKGVDAERGRRERQNNIVAARTNAREERLNNRRRLANVPDSQAMFGQADSTADARKSLEHLPQNVEHLMSPDPNLNLEATTYFRKLLSIEKRPPIEEVVSCPGVVQRLVQFLGADQNEKLQFEAAWALTNVRVAFYACLCLKRLQPLLHKAATIASGTTDHTRHVIDCGAIPVFVHILRSPSEEVREQAVWALGNIAGDHPNTRDMVLQAGALEPLLALLQHTTGSSQSMVRNATWTLSNFCRGKPPPDFERTKQALPTLRNLINQAEGEQDDEIMTDACWALSYLSDGPNDHIQAVNHANVVRRLVELLAYRRDSVLVPALRTVGNIVTGTDEQTQAVINCNALQALQHILSNAQHHKKSIIKEACWTVSNITAGTKEQINAVIESGCIVPIVHLLTHGEIEIKREAAWAISNATSAGDLNQIQHLVQYGCVPPLCQLLRAMDQRVVQVALEGLKNILAAGEKHKDMPGGANTNAYSLLLEDAGGLDLLENLQNHQSEEIASKAVEILSSYFEAATDDNDGAMPVVGQQGMYQFPQASMDDSQSGAEASFNFGGV